MKKVRFSRFEVTYEYDLSDEERNSKRIHYRLLCERVKLLKLFKIYYKK